MMESVAQMRHPHERTLQRYLRVHVAHRNADDMLNHQHQMQPHKYLINEIDGDEYIPSDSRYPNKIVMDRRRQRSDLALALDLTLNLECEIKLNSVQ